MSARLSVAAPTFAAFVLPFALWAQTYTISTVAGIGNPPSTNLPGTQMALSKPSAVAVDKNGNLFFAAQSSVLRLDANTGIVTIVAGNGTPGFSGDNGPATAAGLEDTPIGLAVDNSGNLYISTTARIREVSNGVITTIAGNGASGFSGDNGPATSAQLNIPVGLAVDPAGTLYIADQNNVRVRKVSGGIITTVAGTSQGSATAENIQATKAFLFRPTGVALDSAHNVYIADAQGNRIRKVVGGIISTVAGTGVSGYTGDTGPATNAEIAGAASIAFDDQDNLYIADLGNARIRKVSKDGTIVSVAGNGTFGFNGERVSAFQTAFGAPNGFYYGIAADTNGNVYIADVANNRIRKLTNGLVSTLVGNGQAPGTFGGDTGPAAAARLLDPGGAAIDTDGSLYIADTGNNRIRRVTNGIITTVAGNGIAGNNGNYGLATSIQLAGPAGIAVDKLGNLYIADSKNNLIREVTNGIMTTIAGDGFATFKGDNGYALGASLNYPSGIAVDGNLNLYIADYNNHRIRKISPDGIITTIAGNGTPGFAGDKGSPTAASLNYPYAIALDSEGNLFIADFGNARVRLIANGVISTLAGNGKPGFSGDGGNATAAQLNSPAGVAVDRAGNVFISDFSTNSVVRKVSGGVITTAAGNGIAGFAGFSGDGGPGTNAQVDLPTGLAADSNGRVYIADSFGDRVRLLTPDASPLVIGSLSPSSEPAGGADFTLTITGTDFIPGASVQWNGAPLSTTFMSSTALRAVVPASLTANAGSASVQVVDPGGVSSNLSTFAISPPLPAVNKNGVVPVGSTVPVIQPGSWVSIYGNNLAQGTAVWNGDFPTNLGGVTVTINNKPAYLWYVSPTLINLQAPDDSTAGTVNVVITNSLGTSVSTVTLAPIAPSFILLGDGKHVTAVIPTPDGSGAYGAGSYDLAGPSGAFPFATRPVRSGETLVLYGVGFGPVNPSVPAGQPFSGAAPTNSPVTVTIGGVSANVVFAGLTSAGLYQINLTVPQVPAGDQTIGASTGGTQTPPGPLLAIQ